MGIPRMITLSNARLPRPHFGHLALMGLLLAACTGDDVPTGPAQARLSADSVDFGEVPVGETAEQRVTLFNDGGEVLDVLSSSLAEGDGLIWRIARDPDGDVPGGGSIDLVVTFSPRTAGEEETGRIQVRTSDTDSNPLNIELVGLSALPTADSDGDGFSPADGDCDDSRDDVYPGADELCDGRDNDCDGSVPSDEADEDRDGSRVCAGDCDDADDAVYPGAPEICDDKDSDCDGDTPDRADRDRDGFSICDDDCDDEDDTVSPGLEEICDGLDNDCSGVADDIDEDGDGRSVCKGDCNDRDDSVYSIVVDPSRNPDSPDGTDESPYRTFEEGLANLEPTCATLYLHDASYEVSVDLDSAARLTILGETRDGVVLSPGEGSRVFTAVDGVELTLDTLTVSGGRGEGDGGAIEARFSDVSLLDVRLTGNEAGADGGAVVVSSGALLLQDVQADGNSAADDGGAIAVFSGSVDVLGSTLTGNTGNRGGAVLVESGTARLLDSEISGNTARDTGGGIQLQGGSGHRVRRLRMVGNSAVNGGGAVALNEVVDAGSDLSNLAIMENDGGTIGGGIAVTGSTSALRIANNTLTGNQSSGTGAGIHVGSPNASGVDVVANIVAWNDGDGGIHAASGGGADVRYCLAFATAPGDDFSGDATVGGTGNVSDNPSFTTWSDNGDASDDVLTLRSGSPAINAGPTDASFQDIDGSRNDMGVTGGPHAE